MKYLKTLTTAFLGAACAFSAGQATDMSYKAPQSSAAAPYVGTWQGLYAGLQIGYGWDWSGTDLNAAGTTLATFGNAPHGLTGGGRLGYDFQVGNLVFGPVTDLNVASFTSTSNTNLGVTGGGVGAGILGSINNVTNWWGTTGARVGVSGFADHFLPYIIGGAAYGGKQSAINGAIGTTAGAAGAASAVVSNTSLGWFAGAGAETKITKNVSFFLEGKLVDLGTVTVPLGGVVTSNQKFTFGVVEGGLNYRF